MIDTHTHIYMPQFDADGGGIAAVERAMSAGVHKMILPAVDIESVVPLMQLVSDCPGIVYPALGLHPTEAGDDWRDELDAILSYADDRLIAIGEVGIDLYWDKTAPDRQMQAFALQAGIARERQLPLIIHCREGLDETLEVLSDYRDVPAVFHSFGGTVDDVERIRNIGDYYFGINGIVTFKNSNLREVLPVIGTERLLLETDSPYLAPVPRRGRRNESAYLPYTAAHIADCLHLPLSEIDTLTTANAMRLFPKLAL